VDWSGLYSGAPGVYGTTVLWIVVVGGGGGGSRNMLLLLYWTVQYVTPPHNWQDDYSHRLGAVCHPSIHVLLANAHLQ